MSCSNGKARLCSFAMVAIVCFFASPLKAEFIFYSIDIDSDKLVTINPVTGHVTDVGALGLAFDVTDIDLAFLSGELYGISSHFVDQFAELVKINTSTGSASLISNVTFNETNHLPITHAEGLTTQNGNLYVSGTFNSYYVFSDGFGPISPTTATIPYGGYIHLANNTRVDIDGMGTNFLGQIYGVDTIPDLQQNNIYTIDPTNALAVFIGTYSTAGVGLLSDLDFVGSELYGISIEPSMLHRINPSNGQLISALALDSSATFLGLAIQETSNSVPEPSSLTMVIILGACVVMRRRVQRMK